jgi:N-sulfoglucosamine sulfohydrolase
MMPQLARCRPTAARMWFRVNFDRFECGSKSMKRRELISASLGLGLASSLRPARANVPGHNSRRNILLIIADDQGYDLSCCGTPVKTPVLDQLATQGTLFTQGFATVSSCSSSRSTLYTGLYSHTNGMYGLAHDVHNFSLLEDVRTVPDLLKRAGYRTALVGKKHVKPDALLPYDAWLAPEQPGIRDVAFMAHEAGRWMRAQKDAPFFLTIGFSDPHRDATGFGNSRAWPEVKRELYRPADVLVPSHLPDLPAVREDLAHYYESVSRLDSGVGLVLEELRGSGHESDTLVIYLSDNGRPFPGAKDNLYDPGLHLPLIIRSPQQRTHGTRCRAMVSWIDVAPTMLAWSGTVLPPDYRYAPLPGRSLLPILDEADPPGFDRVYATHSFHEINQYYPMRSVRTRQYSYFLNLEPALSVPVASDVQTSPTWQALISTPNARLGKRTLQAFQHRPAEELYALRSDPDEVVNLVQDAGHQEALKELRETLRARRAATHDPWLPGITDPFGHAH